MATLLRRLPATYPSINRSCKRTFFRFWSPDVPAKPEVEELFKCDKLKFVYDSEAHMKLRELKFDVEKLKNLAAKVSGSEKCSHIKVLAEGTFNRVFSLTMDDGKQEILVKMPFPHAGPQKLLTNSEVATMDFVRTRFKAPVPKVLAWDSSPYNEIGNEYIIMEKLPGQHLKAMRAFMDGTEHFVKDIAKLSTDMASIPFSQFGNIFFKDDVDPSLRDRPLYAPGVPEDEFSERFRIGPSVKRQFYNDGRANLQIDRGPWKDVYPYMKAHAKCEIAWINRYAGKTLSVKSEQYVGPVKTTPKQHVIFIEKWLSILPALIPLPSTLSHVKHRKEPHLLDLNKPTLMHTDLESSNILVTDDLKMSLCGLLDFQAVSIRPAFEARLPCMLPLHPDPFKELKDLDANPSQIPKDGANEVFIKQSTTFLRHLYQNHPALHAASMLEYTRHLAKSTGSDTWSTWQSGLSTFYSSVRYLVDAYKSGAIPRHPKYPKLAIALRTDEVELMQTEEKALSLMRRFREITDKQFAGIGLDPLEGAGVYPEDYELVMGTLDAVLKGILEAAPPQRGPAIRRQVWPYRDGHMANYPEITTCRPV
ncbi:hypothetical protein CPC08DRAFT_767206 [Agrocybe pediades]|nr:hypothetical protein CPC08DRAFT_767206 [Agrocybe pediades]